MQSGQGADEVLGGYDWYPPLAGVAAGDAVEAYSRVFFDRRWAAMGELLQPDWLARPTTRRPRSSPSSSAAPGAETAVDAALRNDTTIMLVDDPVKRVDNMTMAWGLEARVPFLDHELVELAGRIPPELKLADGGKGVLKRAGPRRRARRGDRPDQGLLPGAGDPPAGGSVPGPGARRAHRPGRPKRRGLFRAGRRGGDAGRARTRPGPPWARTRCGSWRCWRCGCSSMEDVARLTAEVADGAPSTRPVAVGWPTSWSRPGAAGARPCRPTADGSPSSATAPARPQLWVQDVVLDGPPPPARRIPLSDDPVVAVSWSADGGWLACAVATDGGVRTQVWVVRPDGSDARRIAGDADAHAELGPWTRSGHRVVVTFPARSAGEPTRSYLADPATGGLDPLAERELIRVLDLSVEERFVVAQGRPARAGSSASVVDRLTDEDHPLLPYPGATGSTEVGAHPARRRADHAGPAGTSTWPPTPGCPAGSWWRCRSARTAGGASPACSPPRDDAELEGLDADDAGPAAAAGLERGRRPQRAASCSTPGPATRRRSPGLPGLVVTRGAAQPRRLAARCWASKGRERPRELWRLDTAHPRLDPGDRRAAACPTARWWCRPWSASPAGTGCR